MGLSLKGFIAVIAVFGLVGCVTTPQAPTITLKNQFDADEALRYLASGNSTVKGSALLRQEGGGVVTCAGLEVLLVPATPYAVERIRHMYGESSGGFLPIHARAVNFSPDSPLYQNLHHKVRCDAQGYFKFENISAGDFYLISGVVWRVGYGREGGTIVQRVSVKDGEVRDLVLTAN